MTTAAVAPISSKPVATAAGVGIAQIHGDDEAVFRNIHDTSISPNGRMYGATWEELRKALLGAQESHFNALDPLVVGPSTTLNTVPYSWPGALVANGFLKVDGSGNLSWTTSISASLASLTDVTLAGLATGQFLFYNGATSKWNNSTATLPTVATLGDTLYASAPNVWSRLGAGTAFQFKQMNAGGTAPQWHTLVAADITNAAALTKVDDTNVTLTLGGTPATALLLATSLTLGWTGTLAAARLNANVVQAITNDTNVTGSITAQNLTLAWAGTLAAARLNANVVQSFVNDTNVTASIAAQVATLAWSGTLGVARGGTNLASYTTGDMLYATSSTVLAKVGIGAANTVMISTGSAPSWAANLPYAALPTGNGSWDTGAGTTITVTRSLTVSGTLTGTLTGGITGSAPAGSLTGTTLAANVVTSSLTTIGTLIAGAVPASLVTSGTFGAGNYIFGGTVSGITTLTATTLAGTLSTASQPNVTTMGGLTSAAVLATVGTISSGVWNGTAIVTTYGGTGLASYATGDMLYFNSGTAFNKLSIGAANTVMTSNGTAPVWSTALTLAGALSATTITASGLMTASASLAVVGGVTYTTTVTSTTNQATPSAFASTQSTHFASTTLGNAQMGFGSTWDVSLLNRAGTVVIGVAPNGTSVTLAGALVVAGAVSGVTTLAMTAALSGATSLGYSTQVVSTSAFATPSAFVATTSSSFASTVSGNAMMGFGTTNDVTLMNRAGTAVLGVTANTLNVTMAGNLAITGTLTGVTTLTATSIGGTLTTAAQPNVTSLGTLTALTVSGAVAFTATAGGTLIVGSDPGGTQLARIGGTFHVSGATTFDSTALVTGVLTASAGAAITGNSTITLTGAGIQIAAAMQNLQAAAANVGVEFDFSGIGPIRMAGLAAAWNGAATTDAYLAFYTRGSNSMVEQMRIASTGAITMQSSLAITGALSGVTTLAMGGALSGVTSLAMSGALTGATTGAFSSTVSMTALTATTGTFTGRIATGTNPNTVSQIALPNNLSLGSRNAANSADIDLIYLSAANVITFGVAAASFGSQAVSMGALVATTGAFSNTITQTGASAALLSLFSTGVGTALVAFSTNSSIRWNIGSPSASGDFRITNASSVDQITVTQSSGTTIANALIVGSDPGGAQLLRVGGSAIINTSLQVGSTIGIGTAALSQRGIFMNGTLTGSVTQHGANLSPTFDSGATSDAEVLYLKLTTAAAAYTMVSGYGAYIDSPVKGAGSAITTAYGLFIASQTAGATNYAIYTNTGTVRFGDQMFAVGLQLTSNGGGLGAGVRYIDGGGTASYWQYNVPTAGGHAFARQGANMLVLDSNGVVVQAGNTLGIGGNPGGVTSTTILRKTVATITNNSATSVLTVTVPNVATAAVLKVRLLGSLGAGGAVGAYEASAGISYDIVLTRTSGTNVTAAISAAYGSTGSTNVTGGTTATVTAALSGISGAAGASNTFTVNVTIARGASTSTNHNCEVFAELDNAVASGVTMA